MGELKFTQPTANGITDLVLFQSLEFYPDPRTKLRVAVGKIKNIDWNTHPHSHSLSQILLWPQVSAQI